MMRLWLESYAEPPAGVKSSAVLSTVAHAVVIALVVAGTANAPARLLHAIQERVQYLPPPDRAMPPSGPSETLHYIELPATGGMGFDLTPYNRHPRPAATVRKQGDGDLPMAVPLAPVATGADSIYSVLEVDSAVTRYANSAAPSYPPDLLARDMEGSVYTEYVVDTLGVADTASLVILRSTHPEFTQAVREALPYMRFHPARAGTRKVRQLVQQQFSFRIRHPATDTALVARRPGQG